MVKLILGDKGSGKTRQLIELINTTAANVSGNVVCIEAEKAMTYDIKPQVRLLVAKDYPINSFDAFRGFLCGLYAGNYDISHIFMDNLCKICGVALDDDVAKFLSWMEGFSAETGVELIATISVAEDKAPEYLKKYL